MITEGGPSVGVVFRPSTAPERLPDVARAVEEAGLDELWVWEDCFAEGGVAQAAVALAVTTRLRVGIGLLPVVLRNPGLTAMEVATVARMFPGRLLPALGHGAAPLVARAGTLPESPLTMLREHLAVVRDLLHGRQSDLQGRYVAVAGAALEWPPDPVPPLLVGARGPKTLRLAGALGDGVVLDHVPDTGVLEDARAQLSAGRDEAGRQDEPPLVVVYDEPPADLAGGALTAHVRDRLEALGGAGATSVVLVNAPTAPDPLHLVEALVAARG